MSFILLLSLLAIAFGRIEIGNMDLPHVEDQYIITYYTNTTSDQAKQHWNLMDSFGVAIRYRYNSGSHKGFSATITDASVLAALQEDPLVEFIEANGFAYALQTCDVNQVEAASWGLSRVSHRGSLAGGIAGGYQWSRTSDGTGVYVYVIDTGILTTHVDFNGRASIGRNFVTGESDQDLNGHGTHCAGTVGGSSHGIAKNAFLVAVKVLDQYGSGTWEAVVAGVDFVTDTATRGRGVASMSLGGTGSNAALTSAINACVDAGIPVVVAAGNSNANACGYTPAGIGSVISVGATALGGTGGNQYDARSSFSNWGTCVHVFAPGTNIRSTWIGSNTATNSISGTSMACPHVAGFAAGLLSANPSLAPEDIKQLIQSTAQKDLVQTPGTGSPNLLLYNGCNAQY